MKVRLWMLGVGCWLLAACNSSSLKPASGGTVGSVVVVAMEEDTLSARMVADALKHPCPALPQPEPMFDAQLMSKQSFQQAWGHLARAYILVSTAHNGLTHTILSCRHNGEAIPQIGFSLKASNRQQLQHDLDSLRPLIERELLAFERDVSIADIEKNHNPKAEAMVKQMFGIDMLLPKELTASKRGEQFAWISNNTPSGMRNICIYEVPASHIDASAFIRLRDSVMRTNIPGELPDMYMSTVAEVLRFGRSTSDKSRLFRAEGLWEMTGDMMGGPFVALVVNDTLKHRVLVAEAFVYAPEQRKRNIMRQLEAALYTVKAQP